MITMPGADPGFLKGGSILGLQAKKEGPGGGPILGPMLKSLHSGPKRGSGPPGPLGSAHACIDIYGRPTYNDRPNRAY